MTIEPHQFDRHADLLARMYARRIGSACESGGDGNHAKRDSYDDLLPVYLVDTDAGMTDVVSSVRLLPTMGPTMTHELARDGSSSAALRSPTVWEGSRLSLGEADTPRDFRRQLARLLLACHRLGLRCGIEALTMLLDAAQIRGCLKAGAKLDVIGGGGGGGGGGDGADVRLALIDITAPAMRTVRERLADAGSYPSRDPATVQQLLPAASGLLPTRWPGRIGLARWRGRLGFAR